jgi:hypothetical protein
MPTATCVGDDSGDRRGGAEVPGFLVKATYTAAGLKGLRAEGGTRRAEVVRALLGNSCFPAVRELDRHV